MADFVAVHLDRAEILEVSGPLGREDIDRLHARLGEMNGSISGRAVILDLSGVDWIDSGGMRALSKAHRHLADRGIRQIVTGMSGNVREALSIGGIDTLLETADSVDTALAGLTTAD